MRPPQADERRPGQGSGGYVEAGEADSRSVPPGTDAATPDAQDGLFEAVLEQGTYGGPRVRITLPDTEGPVIRGPGAPRPTRGPQDARAPHWWTEEAERVVLALAAIGTVTSDDLRARYPDEPSATGAAIGALFKRLGRQDRLKLVEHRPSTRPEARGRVVGCWTAP